MYLTGKNVLAAISAAWFALRIPSPPVQKEFTAVPLPCHDRRPMNSLLAIYKAEMAAGLVIITKPAALLFHVQQYDIFTGL
jgi:hypothetical protein